VRAEKPREIAVRILRRHAGREDYLENLCDDELARAKLSPADRGLAQELAYGVVRWQHTLDWLIARKTQDRTQKAGLNLLLRLGLYQMFWLDRIPDHAAVHETVELAKHSGFGPQSGFVNAVLRGCLRERATLAAALEELKSADAALGFSHPAWLCERWTRQWGPEQTRALLEWNNTPARVFARLNTLRTDAAGLTARWREEGVTFEPRAWDWTGPDLVYALTSLPPLSTLPSFREGLFYVQDPSTLLAVRELDPRPGEGILDLCAAPGGKTTFIAQVAQNRVFIMAQDPDVRRRELVRENCERLGVQHVQMAQGSTSPPPDLSEPFDRVLVDAPCSNTGVIRRRVDLRWRLQPEELTRLRGVQLELLQQGAAQLRPGGTLVYSTCSLEPEENGEVVRAFLQAQPEFKLERERQLTPFADAVDGAYVARLHREPAP
jgi:16S rRNA (cytosine967-C5)-methyltransferase